LTQVGPDRQQPGPNKAGLISFMSKTIPWVITSHGQRIESGYQVAYATPVKLELNPNWNSTELGVQIVGGEIKVSRVKQVVIAVPGFAEADDIIELSLANGDQINCEGAVVTDGNWGPGNWVSREETDDEKQIVEEA
jgi:hypothetical protein